jgi:hypothetical protein
LLLQATARPPSDYRLSLRLVDSHDHVWAQSDSPPLDGAVPTTEWQLGKRYRDPRRLDLEPGTPPGQYKLQVVAYGDETDRQRMVDISDLEVERDPSRDRRDPMLTSAAPPDQARRSGVLGIDLSQKEFAPGATLEGKVALRGLSAQFSTVRLELTSNSQTVVAGTETTLDGGLAVGELRRAFAEAQLPNTLADGTYRLRAVSNLGTSDLGEITVKGRAHRYDLPAGMKETHLSAAPQVEIAAVSVPQTWTSGASIGIAWKALDNLHDNLTAFVHVVDSTDQIVAQSDLPPGRGDAPTGSWLKNEVILDERTPPWSNPRPGTYRVYAGLYRQSDGKRVGPGDGRVLIGTVTIR